MSVCRLHDFLASRTRRNGGASALACRSETSQNGLHVFVRESLEASSDARQGS
jgi:hypothetical protein